MRVTTGPSYGRGKAPVRRIPAPRGGGGTRAAWASAGAGSGRSWGGVAIERCARLATHVRRRVISALALRAWMGWAREGLPTPREPAYDDERSQDGGAKSASSERRAGCPERAPGDGAGKPRPTQEVAAGASRRTSSAGRNRALRPARGDARPPRRSRPAVAHFRPGRRSSAPRTPSCSGWRAILSVKTRTSSTIGRSSCVSFRTLPTASARSS
jgi:hypothetical protein